MAESPTGKKGENAWKYATMLLVVIVLVGGGYGFIRVRDENSRNSDLQAKLGDVRLEYNNATATVTLLNSKVADLNGQIAILKAEHTTDQATVTDLQNQVVSLKGQLAQVQSTIDSLNQKVAGLQMQNTQLQAQINNLQSQVTNLQAQVASLQAKLAALPAFAWVSGFLSSPGAYPLAVIFDSSQYGSLSSAAFSDTSYSVYLPAGTVFSVRIEYETSGFFGPNGVTTCTASPTIFSTAASDHGYALTQNFLC